MCRKEQQLSNSGQKELFERSAKVQECGSALCMASLGTVTRLSLERIVKLVDKDNENSEAQLLARPRI